MNQEVKNRIIDYVNKNRTATIFGFVRLSMVRSFAEVPEEVSDLVLKNYLKKKFDNQFTGGLEVL